MSNSEINSAICTFPRKQIDLELRRKEGRRRLSGRKEYTVACQDVNGNSGNGTCERRKFISFNFNLCIRQSINRSLSRQKLLLSPPTRHEWRRSTIEFRGINVQIHAQDTSVFSVLLHWLTVSRVRAANFVRHTCSDSSHVTAPYKLSFFIIIIVETLPLATMQP